MSKHEPNCYIALCAGRYAELTRQLAQAQTAEQQSELKGSLKYLRESAIEETKAETRSRRWRLSGDLSKWVERKGEITRQISSDEAEALRHYYAVPGGGLLGMLSSVEMALLADLYEGWSARIGLDLLSMIRLHGLADALRSLASFLGPDHEPHDPPARSIHRFIYGKAFGSEDYRTYPDPPGDGARENSVKTEGEGPVSRGSANAQDEQEESKMSPLPGALVDPPTPFESLETWEAYLADLRNMGDFSWRERLIQEAEQVIARKRRERMH